MRLEPRALSRDCTEYSDIPLYCEMKDEPAFMPLQGNLTFFQFRDPRYPLHVREQIQGPSPIPIAEGRLLLRCLWESSLPLQQNPGNQISSRDDMGCMELSSSSCAAIGVPMDLRRVSQGISGVAQRKPSQLSCMMVNGGIALKPMQGNWSSLQIVLGYTELFDIPAVTSVSF